MRRGPCADLFDLVAGTSIGGIIATGLAHRVAANTMYDMLVRDGGTIFAKKFMTNVLNAVKPKYDAGPLEGYLAETFGDAMLASVVKPELIVSTVDLLRPASIFFKSWRAGSSQLTISRSRTWRAQRAPPKPISRQLRSGACRATSIVASMAAPRLTIRRLLPSSKPTKCGEVKMCTCCRSVPVR